LLDLVTTNYVRWLRLGESEYSYLLTPAGGVMDDLMVYRIGEERYLVVVNAANAQTDLEWLRAVARGEVSLDMERPGVRFRGKAVVQDLKDTANGEACLVDLALQGPLSRQVLLELAKSPSAACKLRSLEKAEIARFTLADVPALVSRTGYTGESMGFELFVHPEAAPVLWRRILEQGEHLGVLPVGLGARDSLRTEAGLPLHGMELAGTYGIDPLEAGFGGYVKLHKPFFVGRRMMVEQSKTVQRRIIRFRLLHKGARMLRFGDLVVHRRTRQVMGWVTSAATDGEGIQVGLALVDHRFTQPGTPVALVAQIPGTEVALGSLAPGDRFPLHEEGVVLTRFPEKDEVAARRAPKGAAS
jgi:glycine hydroxymethyltransferase